MTVARLLGSEPEVDSEAEAGVYAKVAQVHLPPAVADRCQAKEQFDRTSIEQARDAR